RSFSFENIRLTIPPEVFHPGFFFSTKLLLRCLSRFNLANKTFLELGAGSGLLSVYAAQREACVTASDINPFAVAAILKNAQKNRVFIRAIQSDLFAHLPPQAFDFIIINPPYYKKTPATWKEHAWYCGENGEFFRGLFAGLETYMHAASVILMVVCDGCDRPMIKAFAAAHSFQLDCIVKTRNLLEKNFVYRIQKIHERPR
ncbi:MAG TPA: methyltransferase, partial [Flavisolibacter sp.]|nr:methyltransferase [Flavisolibacter sp.]